MQSKNNNYAMFIDNLAAFYLFSANQFEYSKRLWKLRLTKEI